MGFRLPGIRRATQAASKGGDVPKGYLAVYVGEKMKRFIIPIAYLNQPSFQELLSKQKKNLDMIIQWVASHSLQRRCVLRCHISSGLNGSSEQRD